MTERRFVSTTRSGIARAAAGEPTATELQSHSVSSLATGPLGSGVVLAGTEDSGVFLSSDRGTTWTQTRLTDETVMAVAVAPSDPQRLYAGVRPSGVFRSDDGGATWSESESFQHIRGRRMWRSPASPPFTAYVQALAVSPSDSDLLVAGIEFGAVVRSTDGGETWSNHRPKAIRDCHSLVWHPTDSDSVYEGGAGIGKRPGARSTDGGETWRKPNGGLDRGYGWSVAAHPVNPDVWYVSASTGPFAAHGGGDAKATIFRRTGEGRWVRLDGINGTSMPYALCTDPSMPDHLWAGLADGSVWHSPNRGTDWDQLDVRLPAVERSMVMLPPE
ncbi:MULTISPECIES: hypothetical protein [Haloferax]|uniref:Glycosyl hydrolase n=1 Tax=Haloferax marinum TaxID=2666143 RepID=A0A6A8G8X3_9EURY|nr:MULTISPECIES: hypothetical protein [Haloferax]KAB1198246.1 hypothetical protein Hfx1150_12275 [Haloferax sp. CBA1150]MRW97337.1 hypothetical protein [Haloferax marinum]